MGHLHKQTSVGNGCVPKKKIFFWTKFFSFCFYCANLLCDKKKLVTPGTGWNIKIDDDEFWWLVAFLMWCVMNWLIIEILVGQHRHRKYQRFKMMLMATWFIIPATFSKIDVRDNFVKNITDFFMLIVWEIVKRIVEFDETKKKMNYSEKTNANRIRIVKMFSLN